MDENTAVEVLWRSWLIVFCGSLESDFAHVVFVIVYQVPGKY